MPTSDNAHKHAAREYMKAHPGTPYVRALRLAAQRTTDGAAAGPLPTCQPSRDLFQPSLRLQADMLRTERFATFAEAGTRVVWLGAEWEEAWAAHLGMTPLVRKRGDEHLCIGEVWADPCGRKRESERWYAERNCPRQREWGAKGVHRMPQDHTRRWVDNATGAHVWTNSPYAHIPRDRWDAEVEALSERFGLHAAHTEPGYGYHAPNSLLYLPRSPGDEIVHSALLAASADADVVARMVQCACTPADLGFPSVETPEQVREWRARIAEVYWRSGRR